MSSGPLIEGHFRCIDKYAKTMQILDLAVFLVSIRIL
jgi:hypothetical protein